jgi:hypothetical protein
VDVLDRRAVAEYIASVVREEAIHELVFERLTDSESLRHSASTRTRPTLRKSP